jgi:hypothetical protein
MDFNRYARVAWWLLCTCLLFLSVAVTNGFVIFFFSLVGSCLLASWMITPFIISKRPPLPSPRRPFRWALAGLGIIIGGALANAHPFYVAAILGVAIHQLRILNRYEFGHLAAFLIPVVSLLPVAQMSHAAYSELVLAPSMAGVDDIIGYMVAIIILGMAIILLKRDDNRILPLLGKSEQVDGFDKVGVPRWLIRRLKT